MRSPLASSVPGATLRAAVWPLPGVRPSFLATSFGAGRPDQVANPRRWHAGVDLRRPPIGAVVLAPIDGTVVAVQGWRGDARAVLIRTGEYLVVLAGLDAIPVSVGQQIPAGTVIGRVSPDYGQVHVETYLDPGAKRAMTSQWPVGSPPPADLRNPLPFVSSMAVQELSLQTAANIVARARSGAAVGRAEYLSVARFLVDRKLWTFIDSARVMPMTDTQLRAEFSSGRGARAVDASVRALEAAAAVAGRVTTAAGTVVGTLLFPFSLAAGLLGLAVVGGVIYLATRR